MSIGTLEFVLVEVEHGVFPEFDAPAVCLMPGGGELRSFERDGEPCLVVDHRRDVTLPARIERWEPVVAPESPLSGLYVLCEERRA
jgi:hypothetical protein